MLILYDYPDNNRPKSTSKSLDIVTHLGDDIHDDHPHVMRTKHITQSPAQMKALSGLTFLRGFSSGAVWSVFSERHSD